jgi:hypothetical protein
MFRESQCLPFHPVEIAASGLQVISADNRLIEQRFQTPLKMPVDGKSLTPGDTIHYPCFAPKQIRNESAGIRIAAGSDALSDKSSQ